MNRYLQKAEEIRKAINKFAENQTDETLIDNKAAFQLWNGNGLEVKAGEIYLYNDELYRVVQDHTTQNDWAPDITPALYTKISVEEFPQWVQPTGAHDSYMKGAKVSDEGKRWVSNKDYNIYKPGLVLGDWSEVA